MHARRSQLLECAAAFLLCFGLLLWVEFAGPAIVDNDGYYHIRWSWMLRQAAPHLPRFDALPLTVLRAPDYVDHHFLFHVLLVPFTFGDLRGGAKLAAPLFSAIALTAVFGLLAAYGVRYRWLWLALLAAGSEPFLYRLSMTRAPSVSLALLALGIWLMLRGRLVWLGVLTFAFVWTYSMFPLMVIVALAYAVAIWLSERRVELGAVWATIAGVVAGLVINPYFPRNLVLMWQHIWMVGTEVKGPEPGNEWFPFETWETVSWSVCIWIACFVAVAAFDFRKRRIDSKPLFFLMLAVIFTGLLTRWSRFVEYWPAFAVLFAAFALHDMWPRMSSRTTRLAMAAAMVPIGIALVLNVREARDDVRTEADPYALRGASMWLTSHTAPGALVFNTGWDQFPTLFYYNQHNAYVCGLDPRYLGEVRPDLATLYESIRQGDEDHPGHAIQKRFGAEYVVTDRSREDFLNSARASGEFETVYQDRGALVLRVK